MESISALREKEFVGRDRELAALVREFEEARTRGQVRLAFVKGPAGIGKTHLFGAARRAMVERGARVFEGGSNRQGQRAYGLLAPLINDLLAYAAELGVPQRALSDLSQRLAPMLGRSILSHPVAAGRDRQVDLCDALAELFAIVCRQSPVLLFPDADAADAASLDLLRFVIAALTVPCNSASAFLVISFRDDESLPSGLADLVARAPGLSVPLAGLDLDGIRSYLSRREVAERLLDATGGVPTALEHVIGVTALPAGHPADLFLKRFAALHEAEADVARALAVLGVGSADELSTLIVALRGAAPTGVASRAERLERTRIFEVAARSATQNSESSALRYSFARLTEREAVLSSLTPAERKILELAAGEERGRAGEMEAAARHFLEADPAGRGVAAALSAAEALFSRCAFGEASELLQRALGHAETPQRGTVHLRLAEALVGTGDLVSALKNLGYARRDLPGTRRELRARAAEICGLLGRHRLSARLCLLLLRSLEEPPRDAAGERAYACLVDSVSAQSDHDRAEALARKGLEWFKDKPALAVLLRNALGKSLLARGKYDEARIAFDEDREQAQRSGSPHEEAKAMINLGVVAHRRGDRRGAIASYRHALDSGALDGTLRAMAQANLGSLYADSGEFGRAVEHLTRAVATFTRVRRPDAAARFALNLASLHLFLGEFDRASELAEHARAIADENRDAYHLASALQVRGEIAETRGDWADAVPVLVDARDRFESLKSLRYAAEASLSLARVQLSRGELAQARASIARAAVDEMATSVAAVGVERELVAGEIALVTGDLSEASRRLLRAKDLLFENPDLEGPYRVHFLLSKLRLAANDSAGAEAEVTRAARLVDELASRVPVASRTAFLRSPRRARVLAAAERGITPAHMATALNLEPGQASSEPTAIVGSAPSLQKVLKVLDAVARSPATVLIRGESGTGKELIADAVHRKSNRRDKPFVKVNCAAMVEDLLLSELFGHEKGSFTGAVRERKGRFELADGGSLFLDEIGDISPKCQVALLRVLQEREFERVGGQKTIRVDVRVMCATNRNLEEMVARGTFREDLYYRLRGVALELPPLRDRQTDLPALCDFFLSKIGRERGEAPKSLSPEALDLLRNYPWPGNIRELENMISAATIFAVGSVVGGEAFETIREFQVRQNAAAPAQSRGDGTGSREEGRELHSTPSNGPMDYFALAKTRGLSLKDLRREVENQCIEKALEEADGNISGAARLLRMKRSRLSQIINADPHLRSVAKGDDSEQTPEKT